MSRTHRSLVLLALAAALAALTVVAVPPGRAQAEGVPCQRTLSSGQVDLPIPDDDLGGVASVIDVPDDGLVLSDVDVTVNIRHTAPSDLVLSLNETTDVRVLGTFSRIFSHIGTPGTGADLRDTVFDDAAITPIDSARAPFTGRFAPSQPLAAHNGVTGGVFLLHAQDTVGRDVGALENWSVTLTYRTCDLDADGVEDHVDQCLGLAGVTASGCPTAARAVSSSYRHGKFRGTVSSPAPGCRMSRDVTVWEARPGPDRRLGTTRTRADGSWRLVRARKHGRFYATSARTVVPGAECPAVRSATFRVR